MGTVGVAVAFLLGKLKWGVCRLQADPLLARDAPVYYGIAGA
jgi:hypothetical protein